MEIPLSQGKVALIDKQDYKELKKYKWSALRHRNIYYAGRGHRDPITGKESVILMHRSILNTPAGMFTDHISGDGLDNRRKNLRVCTRAENNRNAGLRRNNTSGFKGVTRSTRAKSGWIAQISIEGRLKNLGSFSTKELAYEAYCEACVKYHGEFSRLK